MYAECYNKRMQQEKEDMITLAYLNSLWTIQWLGKPHQQPRPLKEILAHIGKKQEPMTDEEMLARVKAINAMLGGEVKIIGGQ